MKRNIAILLSGGTGSRVGGEIPKQYIPVNGKMIIEYSLDALICHKDIDGILIVAHDNYRDRIDKAYHGNDSFALKFMGYVMPGENRQLSIWNALECIGADDEVNVFIHDAARPVLTETMITDYIDAIEGHDGVLPVLPMKDSIYISRDGSSISGIADRQQLYSGQAPEVFVCGKYYNAVKRLLPKEILHITGSAAPAVMAGMDIAMVKGEQRNIKITTAEDLEEFRMEQEL